MTTRRARGDWQTPPELARRVVALLVRRGISPGTVVEPTCGRGAFLEAAAAAWPAAELIGWDIDPAYVAEARRRVQGRISVRDVFAPGLEDQLTDLPEPILVLGNPPWITVADLGHEGHAGPPRLPGARGLDALTGQSNFDVAEWIVSRLLDALGGRSFTLAMLLKRSVARRLLRRRHDQLGGALWGIDGPRTFGASVAPCLLVVQPGRGRPWPCHDALDAPAPSRHLGFVDGVLCADVTAWRSARHLLGRSTPEWRSGVKHDCARVMELTARGDGWVNGLDQPVDIEAEVRFPLLKGSDVAAARAPTRAMVITQRGIGEDTRRLAREAPKAWAYLQAHGDLLRARRSRVYRDRPPYAIFGVGPYAFAPWKIAVAALHRPVSFRLVAPLQGRPVLLDDTCYLLPFDDEETARTALERLVSPEARAFLSARTFMDAKRPITKRILQSLDLDRIGSKVRVAKGPPGQV